MKRRFGRAVLVSAALLWTLPAIAGELALAPIFTDNMVLQRERPVPVDGVADQGSRVTVLLDGVAVQTVNADAAGKWQAMLPPQPAGRVAQLTVRSGAASLTLANIAFGDVFLCSGQSNMEFTLRHATNADVFIAQSGNDHLRLFNVPRSSSTTPQTQFSGPVRWTASSPDSSADFSAACYFMGAELQRRRKVPVGLIAASWGGSVIQEWMDPPTLSAVGGFDESLSLLDLRGRDPKAAEARWNDGLTRYFAGAIASLSAPQPADITSFWEDWRQPGLATFDGSATYSNSITLTAAQVKDVRKIVVGRVDDIDQTLINGKIVGAAMGWDSIRRYDVPAGLLRAGENRIEIRTLDTGGGGGMWGKEIRGLELADGSMMPMMQGWQFRRGAPLADAGDPPYVPWIGGSGLTTLFNGMIAPIGSFPLAGIAWYQGEANVANARQYAQLLPAMMAQWRQRFGTAPFVMAQLANFGPLRSATGESAWAELREAQRQTVAADADAGMAVTIDIGDPYDIHPTNKKDVGYRLALAMEGKRNSALPQLTRDGGKTRLEFAGPVNVIGHAEATGFEACDGEGRCRFVRALPIGPATLMLETMQSDRKIRYLWAESPIANLFDRDGTPLSPFEAILP